MCHRLVFSELEFLFENFPSRLGKPQFSILVVETFLQLELEWAWCKGVI